MRIRVVCDCGKKLVAPDQLAGKKTKCPACGALIRLPELEKVFEQPAGDLWKNVGLDLMSDEVARILGDDGPEKNNVKELLKSPPSHEFVAVSSLEQLHPGTSTTSTTALQPEVTATPSSKLSVQRKMIFSKWLLIAVALAITMPSYTWLRNRGLQYKLRSCESHGIVNVDVYYDGFVSTDVVVFDLRDGGTRSARRIDPVHLFLQFGRKLDDYTTRRVILARNGQKVFYLSSSDLRPLATSYAGGGEIWAFNHLPENVYTMSGFRAYREWSGGWLGVLQKQAEDINEFISAWTGY